jgi:hypothetical protein
VAAASDAQGREAYSSINRRSGWAVLHKNIEDVEIAINFEVLSRLVKNPDLAAKDVIGGVLEERCIRVHEYFAKFVSDGVVSLDYLQSACEQYPEENNGSTTAQNSGYHPNLTSSPLKALAQFVYMIITWDNPASAKLTRQERIDIQPALNERMQPIIDIHTLAKALVDKHQKLKERCELMY